MALCAHFFAQKAMRPTLGSRLCTASTQARSSFSSTRSAASPGSVDAGSTSSPSAIQALLGATTATAKPVVCAGQPIKPFWSDRFADRAFRNRVHHHALFGEVFDGQSTRAARRVGATQGQRRSRLLSRHPELAEAGCHALPRQREVEALQSVTAPFDALDTTRANFARTPRV